MKKILIKLLHFLIPVFIFCSILFVLGFLVSSFPFGHDESVYLTKARSWIGGTPADEFRIFRPIGMPTFGWIFLHFGHSEKVVRTFGVIFGAVAVLLIYLFFRRVFNIPMALAVAAAVGTSTLFLQEAPLFQNDISSTGFLIAVLYCIYAYYETAGKSKLIYLVGPLAALAFYVRYGVATTLGIIGALSLLILGAKFIRKKGADYSKLLTASIISILLFAPHFLQSIVVEKSLFGILMRAAKAGGRKYLGEGLVDYIKWLPNEIGGWIFDTTAIIGVIATVIIMVIVIARKNLSEKYLNLLWIGSIGLIGFLLTGLLVHAERRYIFFPMVLLSGVGIASFYYLIQNRSKIFANLFIVIFLLGTLYYGFDNYRKSNLFFRVKEADPYAIAFVKAAEAIHNDSLGKGDCAIWAGTSNRPRISWYSKCNTFSIIDEQRFEKDFLVHIKKNHYSVVRSKLKEGQISQNEAEKFGIVLTEIFRTDNLSKFYGGDIIVYRIAKKDDEYMQGRDWFIWQ